jgi:nitroimidazol reductase NimA-like FMN-containing flavoprotein (pyridoxamine 5'-phosphate oxidase superfamily)
MQGYGVPESMEGALPWSWAEIRLSQSHNYWLTSVRPDGAPHTMPIWGIWLDGAYYFSTSASSRKGRNLRHNPKCVFCNESAEEAVIVEGEARQLNDDEIPKQAFAKYKAKYGWELDPNPGAVWRIRPSVVFAMPEKQFPKGVTRWKFD